MSVQYRTVIGIVQFDVREGEAAGQDVRNIVVNQAGFKEQAVPVYATLWPSHEDVAVEKDDVVILEGKYNRATKGDKTYNNLSVSRIAVIGKADSGKQTSTDDNGSSDAEDDDIPF